MKCIQSGSQHATPSLWIGRSDIAIDLNGPMDVPYDREAARSFETVGGFTVIEGVAIKYPTKIALDDGKLRLNYSQFIDRVYGLAAHLMSTTEPAAVVASLVPNSVVAPIIIMACALSGRVLVPIDATHPIERQEAIYAESGARALLLAKDEPVNDRFIAAKIPRLTVDPLVESGAGRSAHGYDPDAPLFVSFTSGSTGRPKGIVSGGKYGGSALRHFIDMFHLNPSDVLLGLASLSTGGARDAFAALGAGATIRLLDMRSHGFSEVLRVLNDDKISVLSFVPSALRAILSVDGAEQAFHHLRILDLHGERILASDIELFRKKLPEKCHISITMGSIEAGAVFSWFVRDEKIERGVVPVGYVMPGRRVALLDDEGGPVADGDVGELFARGAMAMGAWKGGSIVSGPFLTDRDDRRSSIYPMGDLMRRRTDGLFEYVGRKDRKVKIHGHWADLGEVEASLRTIDGVADAVVISRGGESAEERLCAFIVMEQGRTAPTLSAVRLAVTKETSEHMAPAMLRVLDAIPRLANFKPDLVRLNTMVV